MTAHDLEGMDGGEIVHRVLEDLPPFERGFPFEPSLLPHIARLCHEESIVEVLLAGELFGRNALNPWPQLRLSVRHHLLTRFTDEQLLWVSNAALTPVELRVHRAVAAQQPIDEELWQAIEQVPETAIWEELTALGCALDPDGQRHRLDRLIAALDPARSDIETVRIVAAIRREIDGQPSVEDLAGAWTVDGMLDPFRAAHLIYLVPEADRPELLSAMQERLAQTGAASWVVALFASRSASAAPGAVEWRTDGFFDPHGVWSTFIAELADAGPTTAAGDTHRAHPFASVLDQLPGPHETTMGVAGRMVGDYGLGSAPPPGGSEFEQAAPPEEPAHESSPPPPVTSSPPSVVPAPPSPAPPTPTAAAPPRPTTPAGPTAADTRRLGVDVFAAGREVERALIGEVEQIFEVSIGNEARFSVGTPAMVEFDPDVEMRRLPVRFVGDGFDQTQTMTLRRDPSQQGKTTFQATPTGTSFSAMVIVYNEDRSLVIQAGHLTADVVDSADAEATADPSIEFVVVPAAPLAVDRSGAATVVAAGDQLCLTAGEMAVRAAVTGVLGEVDRLVEALESAAGHVLLMGVSDPMFEVALRGAARAGARLHSKLELDGLDDADHIQVVSLTGETVLPLELVYDGPAPEADAPLCPDWEQSLRRGSCTSCDRRMGDDRTNVVCPMRFWACRKVIEHHNGATAGQSEFAVRVLTDASSVSIQRPEAAVVGVSTQVTSALAAIGGPSPVDELVRDAERLGTAARVADWSEWTSAVASTAATLLIAMPHQGTISDNGVQSPALELGGIFETTFDQRFFSSDEDAMPGPVLVLLGCETAIDAKAITSFASWFRQWTPVVVATIGEVIADEAPSVAATILDRFDAAWRQTATSTVGEAMREARRTLLADGRLVGLQLVLHGEAAWELSE